MIPAMIGTRLAGAVAAILLGLVLVMTLAWWWRGLELQHAAARQATLEAAVRVYAARIEEQSAAVAALEAEGRRMAAAAAQEARRARGEAQRYRHQAEALRAANEPSSEPRDAAAAAAIIRKGLRP